MIDCVGLTKVWANNCFWTFSQCFRITPKKSYYCKRNELTLSKKLKRMDAVCAFKIEIQSDWVSKRYSLLSSCFNIPMRHFCNFQTLSYTICMIMTFKKANICTASPILYSKNQLLHKEEEKKDKKYMLSSQLFLQRFSLSSSTSHFLLLPLSSGFSTYLPHCCIQNGLKNADNQCQLQDTLWPPRRPVTWFSNIKIETENSFFDYYQVLT